MRRVLLTLVCVLAASTSGLGPAGAATSPVAVTPARGPAIAIGYEFACGLSTSGLVKCWGDLGYGALTAGTPQQSSVPVAIPGISDAVAISASSTTCVLLGTGVVECWGGDNNGLRGDGTTTPTLAPTPVTGITTAVAISVSDHACAVLKNGTIECWGDNTRGELGNGVLGGLSATPVLVQGITNAVAVSTGSQVSCALLADGTARCWGRDSNGALGTFGPALGHSSTPVVVKGISGAVKITSGGGTTCVLLSNGNVKCWGANLSGEAGNGSRNYGRLPAPVLVKKVSKALNVSMNGVGCAALAGGTAKCWGTNYFGSLGTGLPPNEGPKMAALVPRLAHVGSVTAGIDFACAVIADGTARCWGTNDHGQLGNGATSQAPSKAVVVKGLALGKHA
jgi:alpha-tubulin suppressor-like RCC1 family protein